MLGNHGHTGVTDTEIKRHHREDVGKSLFHPDGDTEAGTLADYKREYVKAADVHMTANTFFFPETIEVLEALKSQGAVLGIVSTNSVTASSTCLKKQGMTALWISLWAERM